MKHIEINILQFLSLLIFIFLFTYFWLPKINIKKTDEYRKLAFKYIKLLDEKNNSYNNSHNSHIPEVNHNYHNNHNPNFFQSSGLSFGESTIGGKTSAHSSAINPRTIGSNDNAIVNQFLY